MQLHGASDLGQRYLKLEKWADVRQMKFNVDKCKTMHLGHGNIMSEYRLNNKILDRTHSEKDLGI